MAAHVGVVPGPVFTFRNGSWINFAREKRIDYLAKCMQTFKLGLWVHQTSVDVHFFTHCGDFELYELLEVLDLFEAQFVLDFTVCLVLQYAVFIQILTLLRGSYSLALISRAAEAHAWVVPIIVSFGNYILSTLLVSKSLQLARKIAIKIGIQIVVVRYLWLEHAPPVGRPLLHKRIGAHLQCRLLMRHLLLDWPVFRNRSIESLKVAV